MRPASANALLGLLSPAWQTAIAACLLVVTLLGLRRLLSRGPARMTNGLVVTALLILAVTTLSVMIASCTNPDAPAGSATQVRP